MKNGVSSPDTPFLLEARGDRTMNTGNKNIQFLQPEQCCLYVVDPQERLMAHIHEKSRVIKSICLMIRMAQTFSMPVITNTQYRKGIGPFVPEVGKLLQDFPCPDKLEFNGLDNPDVRKLFEALPDSVDTILLCGVETHICIYQSAIGAMRAGFKSWIVADAVSSRNPVNDRLGLQRLRDLGAVPAPAEMIIYELLRKAGTEYFKVLLPYLK